MPQFTLPNIQSGGQITVNAPDLAGAQQAAASQTGVSLGQQQAGGTFGSNTFGGGAGGAATPGTGAATPLGATPDPTGGLAGLAAFSAQASGVTQAQLAQQKQEFDAQLQFAKDQMTQLGIPQLQINQQLAQLQQQQFQAQLTLAAQSQQYTQNATTAGLTGWLQPTAPVPSVSQWTGQGGGGGGGIGAGSMSWNQLSQQLQQQAGGNYNDAAGKAAFIQAAGANPNSFNGGASVNLSQAQINQIMAAGSNGQLGGGTAGASGGAPTAGGPMSWNQLSQLMQTQAGGSYNDAAGKSAFIQAIGGNPANFNGGAAVNLSPTTLSGILSAGTGGQMTALPGQQPATGAQGAGAPNANAPIQTLAGQLQQATLSGQYQGAPTEAAREFNQTLGLQQGQLGQQYLATAAQLQGPQNTFQLSNYMRGAQGNAAVPTYLTNLAGNVGNAAFQGAGSTAPTPQSAGGLASQLMGQSSATPGWDYGQTQQTLRGLMQAGGQSLKPGSLESLTPDELQALGSGLGSVGGSLPAFLAQYNSSRVGQTAPVAQTSLA